MSCPSNCKKKKSTFFFFFTASVWLRLLEDKNTYTVKKDGGGEGRGGEQCLVLTNSGVGGGGEGLGKIAYRQLCNKNEWRISLNLFLRSFWNAMPSCWSPETVLPKQHIIVWSDIKTN